MKKEKEGGNKATADMLELTLRIVLIRRERRGKRKIFFHPFLAV